MESSNRFPVAGNYKCRIIEGRGVPRNRGNWREFRGKLIELLASVPCLSLLLEQFALPSVIVFQVFVVVFVSWQKF